MKISQLLMYVFIGLVVATSSAFAYEQFGKPTGFVNDYTETLSAETKTTLEGLLTRFQASGKGEVAVVIISTLRGDTIEDYSLQLAREWEIGVKGKDNGVLLFIAKDDRELRIEVGYGFEGVLTDAKSSRIIRDIITPRFKEGNYDAGVVNGVKEILGVVEPTFEGGAQTLDYSVEPTHSPINIELVALALYFTGSIFVAIASILGRSKSWWLGGIFGIIIGAIISTVFGFLYVGIIAMAILVPLGFLFDYVVSMGYANSIANGTRPPWWTGGGSSGGRSGGFGGFGGGSFGGGGASGRW